MSNFPFKVIPPHLVLGDLHVQDDVVDEFGQGFLHCALKLVVLQQRVDKLKDAEHQILETQNLACKNEPIKKHNRQTIEKLFQMLQTLKPMLHVSSEGILLTIRVYGVIHFLRVVDFCSHISERMVKEYSPTKTLSVSLAFSCHVLLVLISQDLFIIIIIWFTQSEKIG